MVTTLTKKMAEDLTAYLENMGVRVRYMHHGTETIERMEIIRDLRLGEFDVLVGINLLREGLDIPGGRPGRHPRRRQGGLPAQRDLPRPDHRPRRPQRRRPGHHVRRRASPDSMRRRPSDETEPPPRHPAWPTTRSATASSPQTVRQGRARTCIDVSQQDAGRRHEVQAPSDRGKAGRADPARWTEQMRRGRPGRLDFEQAAKYRDEILVLRGEKASADRAPGGAAPCPAAARRASAAGNTEIPPLLSLIQEVYCSHERPHLHQGRPRAQPEKHRRRDPARQAGGVYRPVRLRQVLPGL